MQVIRRRPAPKPQGFNFEFDYRNSEWPVHSLGSAIICNEGGGLPYDLITKTIMAKNASTSGYGTHRDTAGVLCNANNEGFRYTLPASLKPTTQVTLFIRLRHTAAPSGTNPGFGGAVWNTAGSSPFAVYQIGYLTASTAIYAGWNLNGTSNQFGGSSQNYDLTQVCNYCMVLTGSFMNLYKNGVRIDSNPPQSGAIGYDAANILVLGEPYASSRNPNIIVDCQYVWPGVALSAEQVKLVTANPFGLFKERRRVVYAMPGPSIRDFAADGGLEFAGAASTATDTLHSVTGDGGLTFAGSGGIEIEDVIVDTSWVGPWTWYRRKHGWHRRDFGFPPDPTRTRGEV